MDEARIQRIYKSTERVVEKELGLFKIWAIHEKRSETAKRKIKQ